MASVTSRTHLALLLVSLAACGGGPTARTDEVLDLVPHATAGRATLPHHRALMNEAKTHRIVLGELGREIVFGGIETAGKPLGALRVTGRVRLPEIPTPVALRLRATIGGAEATASVARTEGWAEFDVTVEGAAGAGEGASEVRLRFEGGGKQLRRARVAVLRPVLRYEMERELASGDEPRQALLITTDTLRADALACYGNEVVSSPNFDRLADDGLRFDRAFSTTNVTNPSHTSMLTSLYLKDHGVDDNFTKLGPDVPTMLEPLRAAGFTTAAFVSSFNFQPERSDLHQRFDEFFPCTGHFERRAEDVNLDAMPWLGEHANDDFFVWLHYFDVHMPYAPPAPYDRMYPREGGPRIDLPIDYKGNPKWFAASRQLGHYRSQYYGELSYLDAQLGELFDRLRALGIYDRAAIVVVADHGEALGEQGVFCEHSSLFDEVTRVPLIVKAPAGRDLGTADTGALVSTVDLYPTFFELLDLAPPAGLRGRSLLDPSAGRDAVFSTFARGAQESLRTDGHRYFLGVADEKLFPRFALEAGKRELFRVSEGGATEDVTASEAARAAELGALLDEFLGDARAFESVPISDEHAAEMEKLGYTQRE